MSFLWIKALVPFHGPLLLISRSVTHKWNLPVRKSQWLNLKARYHYRSPNNCHQDDIPCWQKSELHFTLGWVPVCLHKYMMLWFNPIFSCKVAIFGLDKSSCLLIFIIHRIARMNTSVIHVTSKPTVSSMANIINPMMHLSHIPQYTIQNRNVHISVLNGAL